MFFFQCVVTITCRLGIRLFETKVTKAVAVTVTASLSVCDGLVTLNVLVPLGPLGG